MQVLHSLLLCSSRQLTEGRRDFLLVHVRPADLTRGPSTPAPVLKPSSLARKRPRTPASSSTRLQLQDRQGALRPARLSLKTDKATAPPAGLSLKTDKAHCAPARPLSQDRQGARASCSASFPDFKAHCASCSLSLFSDVHCTYRSATQPTSASPTWQRSEDAGAVADATAAKSKLTGLLLHHQPRPGQLRNADQGDRPQVPPQA